MAAMHSMTGYGQASAEEGGWRIEATVRAVNHRFLDQVLRLPEVCRGDEPEIRKVIGERLARGRVELAIELEPVSRETARVELRSDVAAALVGSAQELSRQLGVGGELELSDLLALPGVIDVRSDQAAWEPADSARVLSVIERALDQMVAARIEEGARLAAIVEEKLDALDGLVEELERLRPQVQEALAQALRQRLTAAAEESEAIEPERLMQEVALLADRSNVSEELERLVVHMAHLREIAGEAGAIGKRLDFLVQEVFRELNTMSAKCRSSEMTRVCVDAKVLCEELREQLRNVE